MCLKRDRTGYWSEVRLGSLGAEGVALSCTGFGARPAELVTNLYCSFAAELAVAAALALPGTHGWE